MHQATEPFLAYQERLDARRRTVSRLERWDNVIANTRLALFASVFALIWTVFWAHWLHPLWIVLPVVGFVVLLAVHERVLQALGHAKIGVEYYERGLARMEARWMGAGWDGAGLAPGEHPYAADLDLFGPGSLFQLLCTVQTRAGGKILAEWLCHPAGPEEVRARQAAIEELRNRLDLREAMAYHGRNLRKGVMPERIAAWACAPRLLHNRWLVYAGYTVSALLVLAGTALALGGPKPPFAAALVLLLALQLVTQRRVRSVLSAAQEPNRELATVGAVLAHLEGEPFTHPYLRALQETLQGEGRPASACIADLRRFLRLQEASLNQLFIPVDLALMWSFHCARAIDAWRARHGSAVGRWLDGVGRLEALCALAAYAYEHPGDPFPTIVERGPLFEAEGLGHPLLPAKQCVRNSVRLDATQRLLIVSGSNMSGKTVLLRTVGINTVLALAGAPVRAHALSVSPLSIGATLNVHDALQEGVSRFYAEIRRIRLLMDLAQGTTPLLFLLDEVFHGTNSWDRRIGAHAVLRNLIEAGAVGIVTTHDLAITDLAGEPDVQGINVHFEDHLEEDRLVFDFQLRPGVVQKSNALELMRAIGLRVE